MGTKDDIKKYPVYFYSNGGFLRIYPDNAFHDIFTVQYHHFIPQGWIKRNKEKFKQIENLQKLFLIPAEMHADLHARNSKFKEKWGVDIGELVYGN